MESIKDEFMDLGRFAKMKWSGGQLLAFSGLDGITSYADGLVARTTLFPVGLEIVDPGLCQIRFVDEPLSDVLFGTDWFRFKTISGQTSGVLLDRHHLLISGDCRVEKQADAIEVLQKNGLTLLGVKGKFEPDRLRTNMAAAMTARQAWITQRNVPTNLPEITQRTLFRGLTMMKGQIYSPEGNIRCRWSTPDRWPHKDMWLWDSGFHAIGLRHFDPMLAKEVINAMFDAQRDDGFIPHRVNINGAASDFTQPPVLGLAAKLVHQKAPDLDWIRAIYPKLCAYIKWDLEHRDSDGVGLAEWFIEEDPVCRSGESGMDNSPRFDCAKPLDAVDFNSFLTMECEILGEFAEMLHLKKDQTEWKSKHQELCRLINERLWSEKNQFYVDYDTINREQTEVLSSAGFLPLICGAASVDQAKQLARHLADPELFATNVPIPSIAVRDRKHYSKDMWRGPAWININWLVALGLDRYGMKSEATQLRKRTITEIERGCEKYGTFFEYYDDRGEIDPPQLLRKGICDPNNPFRQVIHEFGWTATLYVDLVMESH